MNYTDSYHINGNRIYLVEIKDINKWRKTVFANMKSAPFAVLLLSLKKFKINEVEIMARNMVDADLRLFSSWGVGANELESIIDNVTVEKYIKSENSHELEVATISHRWEKLENVLELFVHSWSALNCHNFFIIIHGEDDGKTARDVISFLSQESK